MALLLDLSVIAVLIVGIWQFREPRKARIGNLTAALALLGALALIFYRHDIHDGGLVAAVLALGSVIGWAVAGSVGMIQIPAMVAFQHGAGGVAAAAVSFVELTRTAHSLDGIGQISGILGLAIGALTAGGSMVASAKLANAIGPTPQRLPFHTGMLWLMVAGLLVAGALSLGMPTDRVAYVYGTQLLLAAGFGVLSAMRIGGADMPVLISFLNATAGLAAALCGMVIQNQLLIAFGATVAASGSILTHVMCKAMNRRMLRVFWPKLEPAKPAATACSVNSPCRQAEAVPPVRGLADQAAGALALAKKVIIVPGYGMALAKAQFAVVALATALQKRGASVKYAIHPVAGRMPGHMNVILAEAEVDYDDLLEMEEANPLLADTDVALIVGACDVVNPAAMQCEGTPISGMPILMAHAARTVIVCNFDDKPGYSGVANPLYENPKTILLAGDAKASVSGLLALLQSGSR